MATWTVVGKPGEAPRIGATYLVNHSRKGRFKLRIDAVSDIWCTGTIVEGRAGAALDYNAAEKGESITVRDSLCTFTPVEAKGA